VAGILENYAARGVFRGFGPGPARKGKPTFKIMWHRDRTFEFVVDLQKQTMSFPVVLPDVPAHSSMYSEFREFVESRQSGNLPDHRRIDPAKVQVRCGNRDGNASLTLAVKDGDYEYAVRKLVSLVHEVYMVFLYDGRYYDYLVETFDLDPDRI
jgi:hypothetical protein